MSLLNRSKKLILATLAIFVVSATLLFSVTSSAQNYVGSGVDMRGLNTHSCKAPALALQTRLMQLKQQMLQIIECNRNGGLFQGSSCVDGAAVVTDHRFFPDQGGAPDNRDGLSFNGGVFGLIGGADGASVNCVLASSDCNYDGETIADGDTMTLYEVSPTCGDSCGLVGSYTCNSGTFSPTPPAPSSDIYSDPALCPVGPCAGCTHPFSGAPMVDGDTVTVFDPVRECAESCVSENINCEDGTLSDPVWGSSYDENCPAEPLNCDDCPHPITGDMVTEGDNITLYEEDPSCGSCSDRTFTCSAGSFGDTTGYNYEDESSCLTANSCPPGCKVYVGGIYQETINDGESTTYYRPSTTVAACDTCAGVSTKTCSGGADILFSSSYSTSIGSWSACQAANPCPATCPAVSTTSWSAGCMGSLSETTAGSSYTINDSAGDYTGSATYPCQNDGTWGSPINTSCDGPPPPPVTCPAVSTTSWSAGCMGSLSETTAGSSYTINDSAGDYTGSATYLCQNDGTWGSPTNTSCEGPSCTYSYVSTGSACQQNTSGRTSISQCEPCNEFRASIGHKCWVDAFGTGPGDNQCSALLPYSVMEYECNESCP